MRGSDDWTNYESRLGNIHVAVHSHHGGLLEVGGVKFSLDWEGILSPRGEALMA